MNNSSQPSREITISKEAPLTSFTQMALPGSKSISLRSLVLAALADGVSQITHLGVCDDTDFMIRALVDLGCDVQCIDDVHIVTGHGGKFGKGELQLNAGLSGTSTRFLLALASLREDETLLDGLPPLRVRPNQYLVDALCDLGNQITKVGELELPLKIVGASNWGSRTKMRGDVSSQYFSALLQIAPVLPNGLMLEVDGNLVSEPYIDITLNEMSKFGVSVKRSGCEFHVSPQRYQPTAVSIEGDASAASYFAALATIHGVTIELTNIGNTTTQGDYGFLEICEMLGATVTSTSSSTIITGPRNGLKSLPKVIDMSAMPDVAPTLIAIAPLIPGGVRIEGLSTLRVKECDRLAVPAKHLADLGVTVRESQDAIEVDQFFSSNSRSIVSLQTFDDHRIAMSFAVLASKLGGIKLLEADCVNKTFPRFWNTLASLGVNVDMTDY